MFKSIGYVLLCILQVIYYSDIVAANESAIITPEESLRKALLSNYIKTVIPVENHTHAININVALIVNHFDIDDVNHKAIVHGFLRLEWNDNKLQWNPNDFGGIDSIYLTIDKLWIPDISLYSTINGVLLDIKHEGHLKLTQNGKIDWTPRLKFETHCNLNLRYWPFDKQICSVKFGSWVHSGRSLSLHLSENRPILDIISKNHNWQITNTHSFIEEKIYACCVEPYPSITFTFDLHRKSPMLCLLIFASTAAIVLMSLATFWLPSYRGEKILLNGFNLLLNTLYINYFIQKLPSYSDEMPLIIIFNMSIFILLTISVILSVVLLKLTKSSTKNLKINPGLIRFLQNNILKQCLCLPYNENNDLQKDQTELKDHFEDGKSADNNLLIKIQQNLDNCNDDVITFATFIDRSFFYIYLIVFTILIVICFI